MGGESETAAGIRSKVKGEETDPNPLIKPTKLAVNKVTEYPKAETKEEVQRFIGLINMLCHWGNKLLTPKRGPVQPAPPLSIQADSEYLIFRRLAGLG